MNKRIGLAFLTYPVNEDRMSYLTRALIEAATHITASQDELICFCSCESAAENFAKRSDSDKLPPIDVLKPYAKTKKRIERLCRAFRVQLRWNSWPPSMGANENNAMQIAFDELHCDYMMLHIDDCYATEPIDLSEGIAFLEENPDVDILRYHWSPRKECKPIMTELGAWQQVDPQSKWFYDDSPHVRRSDYVAKFGRHYKGRPIDCGRTESETNRVLRARGARIVATSHRMFEKDGPVSASR